MKSRLEERLEKAAMNTGTPSPPASTSPHPFASGEGSSGFPETAKPKNPMPATSGEGLSTERKERIVKNTKKSKEEKPSIEPPKKPKKKKAPKRKALRDFIARQVLEEEAL